MAWFRRARDEPVTVPTADRIRGAIVELTERRDDAAVAASAALVGQVEVQHAILDQHRRLDQALTQLDDAIALARRVADEIAHDDGEPAALPFRSNVDGLQVQRDVIVASLGQLDDLQATSHSHVDAAREVLLRSRAAFDQALREQLRLLVTFERLERTRVLLAARAEQRGRS